MREGFAQPRALLGHLGAVRLRSGPLAAGAVLLFIGGGPLLAVLVSLAAVAAEVGPGGILARLAAAQVAPLLLGVLGLAAGATVWSCCLAVPLAWLVARTDLPARRLFLWLAPLPLAMPPYVGALVYIVVLAPGGAFHQALAAASGRTLAEVPFSSPIFGPGGAVFILGLFTYPHLFTTVYGALQRTNPSLEEAARGLGLTPRAAFWRVTVPLLWPALLAGSLLIFVYALVDFGVVSLLRVRTFTTAVYTYLLAGFDMPAAAGLSLVLVALVWGVLALQHRLLGGAAPYAQVAGGIRRPAQVALGRWRWPALLYAATVPALALGLPLVVLAGQVWGMGSPMALLLFWLEQGPYVANTLQAALGGATLALAFGTLVAWLRMRLPAGGAVAILLQGGYALPGTVLGLALSGLFVRYLVDLYGTPAVLIAAYVILFSSPAYQAAHAALAQVHRRLEEAARSLGRGPLAAFCAVTLPLVAPGLLGGWMLAFLLSMRELAATLIVRPPGGDTLAVRLWIHTMDVGPDPRGAAVALLLVGLSGGIWLILLRLGTGGLWRGAL